MALPPLTEGGELPQGVHLASLREVLERFGVGSTQRKAVALRLERIYRAARASGHLARFVVFGSFVTNKPEPNDVDVFLLMEDTCDAAKLEGETRGCSSIMPPRKPPLAPACSGCGVWRHGEARPQ